MNAALSPAEEAEFQALMDELNDLPLSIDLDADFQMDFDQDMSDADWEAWGEKWEAWGEQVGARAEQWAATYEARAEAISARAEARADAIEAELEPRLELMSDELEARLESQSAELEALIEQKFGKDFEARVEATSDAIDDLVGDCRDAELSDGETRILSRKIHFGGEAREVKIACIKGNATALLAPATRAAIENDRSLCPDEKQSFRDRLREESELAGAEN